MHSVVIHNYADRLSAIEFASSQTKPANFLVFIGGLGDGFLTVPYVPQLANALNQRFGGNWVVVQALISSSYFAFGTGSLKRDAKELAQLVKYLRSNRGNKDSKVILMGHSTGSQDTLEYLAKHSKSDGFESILEIDAGILQAPASDNEAFNSIYGAEQEFQDLLTLSKKLISDGNPSELLPASAMKYTFGAPITAYRFNSLIGQRGDDDFFSSFLASSDYEKTFKLILKPLLVLYSGEDEFVPSSVDKQKLVDSWKAVCDPKYWSRYSKVVKGASHNVGISSKEGALDELIQSVVLFIESEFGG